MRIAFHLLEGATFEPKKAHRNDAGIDCYAQHDVLLPRASVSSGFITTKVPLGFTLDLPKGYRAELTARSSMNAKGVITQRGIIDEGYKGELSAILINLSNGNIVINKGERICQLLIEENPEVEGVEIIDEEERGAGGFGSSGK